MISEVTYNQDGTVTAALTTSDGVQHHFHFPVGQAGYTVDSHGQTVVTLLATGDITCADAGCGQVAAVSFPLTGDGVAQQAHCMYRYATAVPAITLQQAAQSVITDVEAAGGTSRIDLNTGSPL